MLSSNGRPSFVYVIYIASTPEKVWQALTSEEATEQYWFGYELSSNWKVGSIYTATAPGGEPFEKGVVLESDPPRRLCYSWHPQYDDVKHERPSRVTFELTPFKDQVELKIVHDVFDPGSKVFESISGGWPRVLSSLKSWLETGQALGASWNSADTKRHREARACST
jgi:uncharacterized protein YndB with AHSA1/START domain